MKKFFTVLMMMLALNFLAGAGGVAWLFHSGHLDRSKVARVKELVFPPAVPVPPTKDLKDPATTQPTLRLDQLMAHQTGRPASEQVEFIQHTFDAQRLELDREQRDLQDLKRQVDLANQKLAADRTSLEKEKTALTAREQESTRLQTDRGFQDTLQLYNTMPAVQVKKIFLTLNPPTVQQYLEAMQPRNAAKIIKEFKTPDETAFIQKVLEGMRLAQASAGDGKQP
jgi:flagellar motility protein MotE (MotC chaperone)